MDLDDTAIGTMRTEVHFLPPAAPSNPRATPRCRSDSAPPSRSSAACCRRRRCASLATSATPLSAFHGPRSASEPRTSPQHPRATRRSCRSHRRRRGVVSGACWLAVPATRPRQPCRCRTRAEARAVAPECCRTFGRCRSPRRSTGSVPKHRSEAAQRPASVSYPRQRPCHGTRGPKPSRTCGVTLSNPRATRLVCSLPP
jgi:hypothetical protein